MLKSEVFPYYKNCCKWLKDIYSFLLENMEDGYVDSLCEIRGYISDEQRALIKEMKLGYCSVDVDSLGDHAGEVGLLSKKGNFLLDSRYIIPVYDVAGNLSALIGYYPDAKKYITTPSPYFSKEGQMFNFRQAYELSWREYDGLVFVVEGIFDCLSLRSIGLPAIGCMGATLSREKGELLKLFRKCIAIPDDDEVGRKSLNRYSKRGWKVPENTIFLRFKGGFCQIGEEKLHVKDMDDFVSWYDVNDVRACLLQFKDCKDEVVDFVL